MFQQFIEKVTSHNKIAVFSHVRPDGDCLGAQVALSLWLQKNGVDVVAYNEDDAPDNLKWLTNFFKISKPAKVSLKAFDAFILVDGNSLSRFGDKAEALKELGKPVYMIDHHPDPDDIFEEAISEVSYSSTCELIYKLYEEHDVSQIDLQSAKAIYTGILTDTGSFQFDSVSPQTMHAAADLLERGQFKANEIVEKIYAAKPLKQLKLLSMALETIQLHADGKIATIHVTADMLTDTGTNSSDTEGFVQYPLSVEGVKACVFLREDEDRIKLSLRSQSNIDVNRWARELNGGGHKKAAGGWHPGPIDTAISEVIKIGEKQL